jgi:hypothetical protein
LHVQKKKLPAKTLHYQKFPKGSIPRVLICDPICSTRAGSSKVSNL